VAAEARRVVLLGPPNSGKGTQAAILAERLGVPAISTGDMLRDACRRQRALGEKVAGIMASGELVDDETMARGGARAALLRHARDGFLSTAIRGPCARWTTLEEIVGDRPGLAVEAVLLIDVPEEELVRAGAGARQGGRPGAGDSRASQGLR
jgi:adenylate kinase